MFDEEGENRNSSELMDEESRGLAAGESPQLRSLMVCTSIDICSERLHYRLRSNHLVLTITKADWSALLVPCITKNMWSS